MTADFIPSFEQKTVLPEKPFPKNTLIAVAGGLLLILAGAVAYFFIINKTNTDQTLQEKDIKAQDDQKYGFIEGEPHTIERGLDIERNRYDYIQRETASGKLEVQSKSSAEIAAEKGEEYTSPEPSVMPESLWQNTITEEQQTNQGGAASYQSGSDEPVVSSLPAYKAAELKGEAYVLPEPTILPNELPGAISPD